MRGNYSTSIVEEPDRVKFSVEVEMVEGLDPQVKHNYLHDIKDHILSLLQTYSVVKSGIVERKY